LDEKIEPAGQQELEFDEALALAVLFQKSGQLDVAEHLYGKLREAAPEHPDVLHYSGLLAHQQEKYDEAISLIEQSLAIDPNRADCYSNLGIVYRAKGDFEKAVAAYERAIALNPQLANAHSNLGVLLRLTERPVEAEAAYRKALEIDPTHIEAWHNLGILMGSLRRVKEAVICYCKVTTLNRHHREARRLLGLAYCTLGELDKAIEIYQAWLAEEPDNPIPRHMLAACSKRDIPVRASDAYVEQAFDDFASSFDIKLAHLSYRAPQIVAAILADTGVTPSKSLDILDVGCGTGLCGPLLAPFARRLVGVDLSAKMLARAEERHVYDELVKAELTTYLKGVDTMFDVIVSADTLVYFGALDEVAQAAARVLRPGGHFIFTVEEAVGAEAGAGYVIAHHGRYQHTPAYVERTLSAARLQWHIVRAELRMESGVPVAGLAVRAMKGQAERDG
jgi:predicted TPR repeat methyltransferase